MILKKPHFLVVNYLVFMLLISATNYSLINHNQIRLIINLNIFNLLNKCPWTEYNFLGSKLPVSLMAD